MNKLHLLLGIALVAGAALAGCADNDGVDESTAPNDVGPDGDCDNRNWADDDVISDDDGVTLGECEENAADR